MTAPGTLFGFTEAQIAQFGLAGNFRQPHHRADTGAPAGQLDGLDGCHACQRALLAAQAEASPGVDHVMVIDEINRANLPKVFGELLFLLEYRDEQVQTLYRSEDAFELPNNLLFIGTMNTADKSIALIDAALRRRFHFVPFFPHEEPHNAVLASWLEDNNSDALWVAGLVEHVNERLIDLLGGPHLQIGPSHFFSKDLDEDKVRRIWRYSVLPFIEDQLWGQAELLRTFEFDQVLAAYRAAGGGTPEDQPAPAPAQRAPSTVSKEGSQVDIFTGEELPVTAFPTRKRAGGRIVRGPVARKNLTAWRDAKAAGSWVAPSDSTDTVEDDPEWQSDDGEPSEP